jgi:hypothetical protein
MKNFNKYLIVIFITAGFLSCTQDDLDLSTLPLNNNNGNVGDTTYIPITPELTGFNNPIDIYMGYEPLIYIADKDNNRIVQMDRSGALIGYSDFILKPRKITQDKNYDLLVIASVIDTIPPNILDTIDAVYRYKLRNNGGLLSGLRPAIVFKSNQATPIPGDHGGFTGISAFQDNYYLVFRSGPHNTDPVDPDNAVFRIDKYDNTQPVPERLTGFQVEGQGLLSLLGTSSVTTLNSNNTDFIYTETSSNVAFKIQWAVYDNIEQTYTARFTPESGVDLLRNGLVIEPQDITLDQFNNIYIIDSYKDSLYKFNSLGKLKSESFGGHGSSNTQFNSPTGVAFFDKTLYICDSGNNRILRFILSTDIN